MLAVKWKDVDVNDDNIQSLGGKARAASLSPEQRSQIAKAAAEARWDSIGVLRASHDGELKLAGRSIAAAVLPNGKRLLTQGTFLQALGRSRTPKARTGGSTVDGLPFFLQAEQLQPFISDELKASTTPIFFRLKDGRKAVGYDAQLLPMVCEVYLKFRDACLQHQKSVPGQYKHIVDACDLLMRGLAHVGIAALVDEATGYQEVRDRMALQKILEAYLLKEFAAWAKRFPDEFYKELFRLRGWSWNRMSIARPGYVGKLTNDLIYERLAPGILDELRKRNPQNESGVRRHRHHQLLTEDVGHTALAQHLHTTIALMKGSDDWKSFYNMMERALPKKTGQLPLLLEV